MDNKYRIYLAKDEKKNIYLSVENIKEHTKYEISINEISPFWLKNMKYFQHDFNNFYRILDLVFEKNSKEIQWKITEEKEEKISLNINYLIIINIRFYNYFRSFYYGSKAWIESANVVRHRVYCIGELLGVAESFAHTRDR